MDLKMYEKCPHCDNQIQFISDKDIIECCFCKQNIIISEYVIEKFDENNSDISNNEIVLLSEALKIAKQREKFFIKDITYEKTLSECFKDRNKINEIELKKSANFIIVLQIAILISVAINIIQLFI
jgi:hypothetical protein